MNSGTRIPTMEQEKTVSRKVRVACIGGMGRGPALGRCFNLTGKAEVVAVADLNPEAFAVGRERFEAGGAKPDLYTDVAEMLKRKDFDWVIVGTPDRTHFDLGKQVMEAGHNLLMEKPITQTTTEADGLCQIAEKTGVKVVVGCELRYSAFAQTIMREIRAGRIGRPITGVFIDHLGRGYSYFLRDHRKKKWGRGLLMQKGVHAIDLMVHFCHSDPVRVYGSGGLDFFGGKPEAENLHCRECGKKDDCAYSFYRSESPTWLKGGPRERGEHAFDHCVFMPDTDAEDNMHLVIDFANGMRFSYTSVFFAGVYSAKEVFMWGTEGTLHGIMGEDAVTLDFIPFTAGKRNSPHIDIPVEKTEGGHGGADERFVEAITSATLGNRHMTPDIWDGRAAVTVAEMGLKSIEARQPFELKPRPDYAWKRQVI